MVVKSFHKSFSLIDPVCRKKTYGTKGTKVVSLTSPASILIYLPTVHAYSDEPNKVNTFFDYCIMILIPILLVDISQQKEYNGNIAVVEQVLTGFFALTLLIYMSVKAQNPLIDGVPVITTIVAAVVWLFAIVYIIRRKRKHYKRYYKMLPHTFPGSFEVSAFKVTLVSFILVYILGVVTCFFIIARFWWLHFDGFINDRKIPVLMSLAYVVPVYMHYISKDSFISIWAVALSQLPILYAAEDLILRCYYACLISYVLRWLTWNNRLSTTDYGPDGCLLRSIL
ncbi:8872_t:CDS:1 [Funneliformis geosporum]|uniref:3695_t:CDS:1 n=1 Tax=Funneliformis geosporum TaxID=1117311 RepID=A0A9W4SGL7_9GLOM|nr:3695_t:CDS:1 [Funneliformis geosporum]CAI2176414.1 8872_t:CDS:1 [Funneliformis geosporum]